MDYSIIQKKLEQSINLSKKSVIYEVKNVGIFIV